MLDILRKNAASWTIRIILGAIIVSFVIFFGYNRAPKGERNNASSGQQPAIEVNDASVSVGEFRWHYAQTYGRISESFKGKELPDYLQQIAFSTTQQRMMAMATAMNEIDHMGIVIPDEKLATIVRKSASNPNGEFDLIEYRDQFMPDFYRRFGVGYENVLTRALKFEEFAGIFEKVDSDAAFASDLPSKKFLFEVAVIDPAALIKSGAIKSADDSQGIEKIAKDLASSSSDQWQQKLSILKLTPTKKGPYGADERRQILDGAGTYSDFKKIFALTKEQPILGEPILNNGKYYVVKFISEKEDKDGGAPAVTLGRFFENWIAKAESKAKIKNNMGE